ncbi:MAG TPA: UDP-N-acetylglucosamine 1-carboxyvinyltransferase [Candidatus Nitrosotalea sp.]|nr:UDP-N-acetylglucosamine 1-carboxyvinyltransferase [Candidatus Nitrosotalea sp.]
MQGGEGETLSLWGGARLSGEVAISGSKNASLPIMAASLLTADAVELENLPEVADTTLMAEILRGLGAEVELGAGRSRIQAAHLGSAVPEALGRRMRASIVLLGALLARTGHASLPKPGGDQIGARRVEQHVRGLRAMGAEVIESEDQITAHAPHRLRGARVIFDLPTVTGTENIMLAAVLAEGRSEILNAAREPHVEDLARFLNAMGAAIAGAGTDRIVIDGVERLHGAGHRVVADYLEAGTYALAVVATGGDVTLENCPARDLTQLFLKLEEAGASIRVAPERVSIARAASAQVLPVDMCTFVHPGFPTDLQAQYLALMTQAQGESVISEYLFENRFQHVPELVKMGARITIRGRDARVEGPARLRGTDVSAPDIRSGAALIIAGLCADGETRIHQPWHIDRGYQDMVGKLIGIGARVARRGGGAAVAGAAEATYE